MLLTYVINIKTSKQNVKRDSQMTRQADPKVKDNLHVRARSETERRIISDLKQLAIQDQVELADLIFEGIQYMFKAHHWPPGNPQLQLTVFQKENPSTTEPEKCKCGRPAIIHATDLRGITKIEHHFCQKCFSNIPSRYDPKIWKIITDNRKTI